MSGTRLIWIKAVAMVAMVLCALLASAQSSSIRLQSYPQMTVADGRSTIDFSGSPG